MSYKPYIGKGDKGFTDFHGTRMRKDYIGVFLVALIDEINAIIGVVRNKEKNNSDLFFEIQNYNIKISGVVAGYLDKNKLNEIFKKIDYEVKKRSNIKINEFIIFGDDEISSLLNLIRTKIRISELIAWKMRIKEVARVLNRLSDLFFLLAVERKERR